MKDLGTVLKEFRQKYPQVSEGRLAHALEMIKNDEDVQNFWRDHQGELRENAFTISMMDLFEFVVQKKKAKNPETSLYPGYYPILTIEKGYPHVTYQASEVKQQALMQKKMLKMVSVPKDVRQADLKVITAEMGQHQGREAAVSATVRLFDALVSKYDNQDDDTFVPGLYLYGDFGVGKTYLMGALANALSASGVAVMMVHWTSMIEQLKSSFNRSNDQSIDQLLNQAKQAEVLILDDMGTDNLSAWARDSILSVILEYRMQNELTTCFTSNFDLSSLEEYLAQTKDGKESGKAARLMQRVQFLAQPVAVAGQNLRLQR
ncbi:primosomal protein DnaI [Fructobacillus ficulneus]|uniref:Putative primosomal protein DnaI n=1 Tax=Fructobacillus ficulneus TaxID=157463 RepID=A0A0K8MGG2_9LACO|nr:primosomal protein DnaI [Fructobacillus ficulneus]GAO99625.1 putative primosomal protein DnaI [Fructobacillus ficulneus]